MKAVTLMTWLDAPDARAVEVPVAEWAEAATAKLSAEFETAYGVTGTYAGFDPNGEWPMVLWTGSEEALRKMLNREFGELPDDAVIEECETAPESPALEMTWKTMTVGGCYGSDVSAPDADAAEKAAEAMGYKVLDVMDDVIVIAD